LAHRPGDASSPLPSHLHDDAQTEPGLNSAPIDRKAATVAAAISLLFLAVLSFAYRDLLLQWQPVSPDAAWRIPAALVSGAVLLVVGAALFVARFRRRAATVGAAWIALWVVALQLPLAVAARGNVAALLGVAECAAMAFGLAMLAVPPEALRYRRVLVASFGVCAPVFGLSHFVDTDFTAAMVPDWLPAHRDVALLTGAVHAGAGLCMLFGIAMPLAAWVETMMMSASVVLLHVPRVLEVPKNRCELTTLAIAMMLTSAAWIVAASTRGGLGRPRSEMRDLRPNALHHR
jgi:uncharacterized membrane protein